MDESKTIEGLKKYTDRELTELAIIILQELKKRQRACNEDGKCKPVNGKL